MTITALIIFVALYCWLGHSWRKNKQPLKEFNRFIVRLTDGDKGRFYGGIIRSAKNDNN